MYIYVCVCVHFIVDVVVVVVVAYKLLTQVEHSFDKSNIKQQLIAFVVGVVVVVVLITYSNSLPQCQLSICLTDA